MRAISGFGFALLTAANFSAPARAESDGAAARLLLAQASVLAPIPKPSERKTGELEGWSDQKKAKPETAAPHKTRAAAAPKSSAGKAAAQKPAAREAGDGGLPLPSSRMQENNTPVMFDSKGNIGTGLKF